MRSSQQPQGFQGEMFFAKPVNAKQNEKVGFEISKRDPEDEKKFDVVGKETSIAGKLYKATVRHWAFNNDPKVSIVLKLRDSSAGANGEIYRVELPMGSITRNVINCLLSAMHFNDDRDILTIRLYNNKKGYASVWVGLGIDGTGKAAKLTWKFSQEELNKYITKDKTKGKDPSGKIIDVFRNNYLELDSFLLEQYEKNIVSQFPNQLSDKQEAMIEAVASTDDLPF